MEGLDYGRLEDYLNTLKEHRAKTGQVIPNFIIFDDLQSVLSETPQINSLFSTFRHYGSSLFLCVQYMAKRSFNNHQRENTDYLIAFNSKTELTIKSLFNSFGQFFDNYNAYFKNHFLKTTSQPYTAMLFIEDEEDLTNNYLPIKAVHQCLAAQISIVKQQY